MTDGFWDPLVGIAIARGIRFEPNELPTMENGGEALHIGALPHWDLEIESSSAAVCVDNLGDVAYYVEPIDVLSPWATWQEYGYDPVSKKYGPMTRVLYQKLDEEYGELWRAFPSYVGTVKEKYADVFQMTGMQYRMENPFSYRFWNTYPWPGDEIVQEIVDAVDTTLMASHWYDLRFLSERDMSGEAIGSESVWAYKYQPSLLSAEDLDFISAESGSGFEEDIETTAQIMQGLIDAGHVQVTDEGLEWVDLAPNLMPVEQMLTGRAQDWFSVRAYRSKVRYADVRRAMPEHRRAQFDWQERQFA